ncbi:MAG: MBOAT family protein [Clostridia bacterium]|nr:MBOAT family protein [Clostridia bacterium]
MIFSSILFLMYFLPLVLGVYYIVPKRFKNFVLLIFSLVFYAWGEPLYIGLMAFSIIFNYICGLLVKGRKGVLVLTVVGNLAGLFFFKYTDFFIDTVNGAFGTNMQLLNLALPVGISFYTFQAMSYVIDVYRGNAKSQKNIISFGTYIALFPQLIAGPIVRYNTIDEQLSNRKVTAEGLAKGIVVFVVGLGKKVLIANNIGMLWDTMSSSGRLSVASAWLGIFAFALQIYFDFSGYSDMAIGLGRMFGFEFEKNFNYPYVSTSITDFWRRWHISLSTWFKEYVYIPLGGNRVSPIRKRFNLLVVWLLTGFWHGAGFNFILWGLYYAIILILEKDVYGKYLSKFPRFIKTIYSLFLVLIGWVFFASPTVSDAFLYIGAMFGRGTQGFLDKEALYALSSYGIIFIIGFVAMLPFGKKLFAPVWKKHPIIFLVPCIAVFALCVAYLADASYNPFLYFRF